MIKILFISILGFCSCTLAYSQDVKKADDHKQSEAQYCCVKKDFCGEKAKKCPNDNMPLIKAGLYYCTSCNHKSKKPGMCGKCDIALVKMEKKD